MFEKWISASTTEVLLVVLSCAIVYPAILMLTRLTGLRSFSKMSAADFAMTVAVGSLFASTISGPKPTLILGTVALATLFAGQRLLASMRRRSRKLNRLIDNRPVLLMAGSEVLDDHLARVNMTRQDLYAKLREANALNRGVVRAVVFETTGDVSVLQSSDPSVHLDPELLTDVVGAERLLSVAGRGTRRQQA